MELSQVFNYSTLQVIFISDIAMNHDLTLFQTIRMKKWDLSIRPASF